MAGEKPPSGNTENQHVGPVHGPMVQASHIDGGVHVHNVAPDRIVPQQLPGVTWHFTGRATELAELTSLLDNAAGTGSRTVVISASEPIGGMGTTALATRWAAEFASRFPDGALYWHLRGSDELAGPPITPDQVIRGFLSAFGVPVPDGPDELLGTYRSVLAGRRVLLLLDDARDAEQVRPLLPGNSASWAVVTSRRPLPDLVAPAGARPLKLGPLPDDDARALLARHIGEARLTNEPYAVAELVKATGGVPLTLNILAAHAAAWPNVPLTRLVAELRKEREWLGESADQSRVVYSWARQRADTGPVPRSDWSASVRSVVEWARRPQALMIMVAVVIATFVAASIPLIKLAGVIGVGYLLLRVAVLVGAVVFLTRMPQRHAAGVGFAAAMAAYLFGDATVSLNSRPTVWQWLYFLAALGYLGVLVAQFWPFREVRRKPRFIGPATRPLAFLVLGGVFGQIVLLFVAVPYNCLDFLGGASACSFTVSTANGALGTLFFVVPIAALCVLVALTEPLDEPRRNFVIAAVVAFFGPELFLMLGSLVLGQSYTYVGDDTGGARITAVWFVLLNAAMFVAIAVGTVLIARPRIRGNAR